MISNQILQSTIDGLSEITKAEFCVVDSEGKTLASNLKESVSFVVAAKSFAASPADSQEIQGYHFFKIHDELQIGYILIVAGSTEESYTTGKIAAFQIQTLLIAYRERFDKDNFIKNLLLDNLLLVDIYNRSKKLHIETTARRVVIIAESSLENEYNELEILKTTFSSNPNYIVTAVDEKHLIVVKQLEDKEDYSSVEATAEKIYHLFNKGNKETVHVSYGTIVPEIREVSRSYKEAKLALDVGRIFFEDRKIIAYSSLGIGRLIYQLPIPLCKMFIKEIFGNKSPDDFDEETITTINKFFENSLNVSETSRQLFIHRNTLVYRLDKLQKSTGLDLRVFEDAITFKIALMVVQYMKYVEEYRF